MWFDIFGTESLTLPGSGWLASATRKQSLLIFRTTESDHCVQGQAGQAATCDQPSPHRVHTQPSQSKQKLRLCSSQPALKSLPTYCHYRIQLSSYNYSSTRLSVCNVGSSQ